MGIYVAKKVSQKGKEYYVLEYRKGNYCRALSFDFALIYQISEGIDLRTLDEEGVKVADLCI